MSDLLSKKCLPCEGGVPPLDLSEIHKYQKNYKWNKNIWFFIKVNILFLNFVDCLVSKTNWIYCGPSLFYLSLV